MRCCERARDPCSPDDDAAQAQRAHVRLRSPGRSRHVHGGILCSHRRRSLFHPTRPSRRSLPATRHQHLLLAGGKALYRRACVRVCVCACARGSRWVNTTHLPFPSDRDPLGNGHSRLHFPKRGTQPPKLSRFAEGRSDPWALFCCVQGELVYLEVRDEKSERRVEELLRAFLMTTRRAPSGGPGGVHAGDRSWRFALLADGPVGDPFPFSQPRPAHPLSWHADGC